MAFVGIDLGTTNSLIATKKPQRRLKVFNIKGEDKVSLEEETRFYLPSAVSSINGEYLVGWEVVNNRNIEERIFSIKRLMGRGYDDRDERKKNLIRDKINETWGYKIRKPPNGTSEDIEVKLGDDWLMPQEVSSLILRRLKEIAEQGSDNVEGCVITVPAYFNDKQKWATREAARLAGLNVQMILDEPTAAAIAYGMETLGSEPKMVLVYDLGGGTFDVSLLDIIGANFDVLAIDGDNWLGGDDFDAVIMNYVLDRIGSNNVDVIKNSQIKKNILKQRARDAKEALSANLEASIIVADLVSSSETVTIKREEFERMISPYINETIDLVDSVLREKSIKEDNIDKLLLVGGSTRIPLVRECLTKKFGEKKIAVEIDPMLCVATGAAIKSSWLLDRWECLNHEAKCRRMNEKREAVCSSCGCPRPETRNSTERPYGVSIYDREKGENVFDVLIPKAASYPLDKPKKRIYGVKGKNAVILNIPFYAGEKSGNKHYYDNIEKNTHLGTIWALLPKGLATNDKVEINFNLDNNGILDIEGISINIGERAIERKAIIRNGEEANIAKEIEGLLKDIYQKVLEPKKKEVLTDSVCKLLDSLFDEENILNKTLKGEKIKEIKNKIEEVKNEIGGSKSLSAITGLKNIILNSYYIEKEYGWLPFLMDKSRKDEIIKIREKLKPLINEIVKIKDIKEQENKLHENEWEINLLTGEFLALFSDASLDLLWAIKIAAGIAWKGELPEGIVVDIVVYLERFIDKYKTSENIFEERSQSDRIKDAEELDSAHTKIVMLLKQGKIEDAQVEFNKISNMVIYYLTEFRRKPSEGI